MHYEERPAPAGYGETVSRTWFLEAPRIRRFEKILPLPFVHVIVNLSEPYAIYDRAGNPTVVDDAFLAGLQSEYLVIESPPVIRHVGIELRPAGLAAVTEASGPAVAGRVLDARPLVPGLDRLVPDLAAAATGPVPALDLVADMLTARAPARPDAVASAALAELDRDPGRPIADVARAVGTSPRTMLARVRAATGISPKTYAQLVRFHRVVTDLGAAGGLPDWAGLAADAGYYDQPHVIRAFRRFTGWSPTEYRRRVAEFGPGAASFVPMAELPVERDQVRLARRPPSAS